MACFLTHLPNGFLDGKTGKEHMFATFFNKFKTLADHHQIIFALIIALSVICVTWAIEKILEHYIFPTKPLYGYIILILGGLVLLWLTQHFVLHVI